MSKIVNSDALIKALMKFGDEAEKMIILETEASGREIEANAKEKAPVNFGKLKQSINYSKADKGLTSKIAVNVPYGAYVEFGTRSKVQVPPEMQAIASQFKGKGGSGSHSGKFSESDFFLDILDWVKKKGIVGTYSVKTQKRTLRSGYSKADENEEDEEVAFVIAMSILKNGISPQPYLYPAFVKGRKDYINRLTGELVRLTQKFK